MKIIVTHSSPDLDAITSIWLIKKFLPGWENAEVRFVPAGERLSGSPASETIEIIEGNETIHVDTGLGPLDHHQIADENVCAASLTWDYVKKVQSSKFKVQSYDRQKCNDREDAVSRIVKVVVDIDHFKEVFWDNPTADYHEFSLVNILEGLKLQKVDEDLSYVSFMSNCLDALLHEFENRIWAEREIKTRGVKFTTRFGKGIGFETLNDSVVKLAQKMGYVIAVRKDPRKGYIRIKATPYQRLAASSLTSSSDQKTLNVDIDLTLAYEKFKKMDPEATWFLHISKKMLLNGSVKNPKMRPTRLKLSDIIGVLEKI